MRILKVFWCFSFLSTFSLREEEEQQAMLAYSDRPVLCCETKCDKIRPSSCHLGYKFNMLLMVIFLNKIKDGLQRRCSFAPSFWRLGNFTHGLVRTNQFFFFLFVFNLILKAY